MIFLNFAIFKIHLDWLAQLGPTVTTNVNIFCSTMVHHLENIFEPSFFFKNHLTILQVPQPWVTGMRNVSGVTFSIEIQRIYNII